MSSVRAPDSYVYPAPFNLVELFILPLEWIVSKKTYARINRVLMSFLFFLPLCVSLSLSYVTSSTSTDGRLLARRCSIALFETHISPLKKQDLHALLEEPDDFQEPEEDPEPYRNASEDDADSGEPEDMQISRVSFADLKKRLPSLERSVEGEILFQVRSPLTHSSFSSVCESVQG